MSRRLSNPIASRGFGGNKQDVELHEVDFSRCIIRPLDNSDISVLHTYNTDDKFTVQYNIT
jgi:hypothetical protein